MSIEAMKLALEALQYPLNQSHENFNVDMAELISHRAITALRQAIEQAEQAKPVAWIHTATSQAFTSEPPPSLKAQCRPLVFGDTAPPRQLWVGLTDEEIWKFWWARPEVPDGEDDSMEAEFVAAVRRVLAAHGMKGEG